MASSGSWVRDLSAPGGPPIEPACSASTIRVFTERIGEPAVRWAVWTAAELVRNAVGALPRFAQDPGEGIALRMGVEAGTLGVLASILRGRAGVDPAETPEMTQSAQEYVHRGVPLSEVWASVRHTHRELTGRLITACSELVPDGQQVEEITLLTDRAFEFVERLADELGRAYDEESDRWLATAASARAEVVGTILDSDRLDLESASLTLRYEIRHRHHIAVVASREDAGDESMLRHPVLQWMRAAGVDQTVLVPKGRSHLWAWGNRRTAFDDGWAGLDLPDAEGTRLAVGRPAYDVEGFRTSHADARVAHRVIALGATGERQVVDFPSVSLVGVLTENETRAREFVASELGLLADEGDPWVRDLRRTVLVHLETNSVKETASRLFVVRNTVAYRLARVEELLGRPLTDRRLELWVALVLAEALTAQPHPPDRGD